jgi:MacB-like periplasmic core domain
MDNPLQDVRYGLRMLVKNPGLTAVGAISLSLGMGANTTIFSLINAALLRPLPVERPDELVMIYTSDFSGPVHGSSSYPDYLDIRDKTEVFSGVLVSSVQPLSMSSGGETERVSGEIVTGNYFSLLGVKPVLGRNFLPEEDQTPGARPVALVSCGLWQRRFGSDPNIVGQLLTLNGEPVTIVGVAPDGFLGLQRMFPVDLWVPMMTLSSGRPIADLAKACKSDPSLKVLVYDRQIGCRRTVGPDARVDIMSLPYRKLGPTSQPGGARRTRLLFSLSAEGSLGPGTHYVAVTTPNITEFDKEYPKAQL